ncbi:MAG: hypothetical protein IH848_05765, partial [Acidobacteria bacterium]|nr:hypothetical protein [Acidobacteriota bacterium]
TATDATAATLDWTALTSNNVNRCARITLFAPGGASTIVKAFNTDDLSPYDVLSFYQTQGSGQYTVELTDSSDGACSGSSSLSGATLSVDGVVTGGDWNANARVLLWDGSTQTIVKDFGAADANPYDISSLYTGSAQYEVRLEAQNGEAFRMTDAVMSITQASCDASACVPGGAAPPVADGVFGTAVRLAKGVGANDIDITFDTATCTDDHAIVAYGDIGNFNGYQGAVDTGCNLGAGGNTTFTHAGGHVWFNVLWVTGDDKAGHPGFDKDGLIRPWNAVGLCGATSDDQSNGGASCATGGTAPTVGDDVVGTGIRLAKGAGANEIDITFDTATCSDDHAIVAYGNIGDFSGYQGAVDTGCNLGAGGNTTFTHTGGHVWFNVLWVTHNDKAGHPGYDGSGFIRPWNAVGLCGASSDDQSNGVCN